MNTSSSVGLSTLKPCGRILFNCKNSLIFGFPFPKFNHLITDNSSNLHSKLNDLHYYSHRIIGCTSVNNQNRRAFSESGSNSGQSRVFSGCPTNSSNDSFVSSIVANVASSDIRNHSISSVEVQVNENSFDKIYVGGGLDLKPFVIDTIEKAQDILANEEQVKEKEYSVDVNDSSSVNIDDFNKGLNGSRVLKLTPNTNREVSEVETEAWKFLRQAVVNYCGHPVGTVAAADPADKLPLNYDQVFVRDFVPSALAFLLNGEGEIVKNFLLHTLQLQSWEKTVDCHSPGQGLMPASFKVRTVPLDGRNGEFEDVSDPDFGESAIGRVAPVDSGLWWIILLRAYGKITGDYSLQERVEVQTGIKLILNLCLTDGFDMFPTLLVTDGSCMIDRRLGIHGHPLEIQSLFYSALRCSREMLTVNDSSKKLVAAINNRLSALSFHIREYYWVDMKKINEIYRYKTEEYSTEAINKFNIYPDQIPSWLVDWISETGGYFIGNLQPAHMDFRFFTLGNLWAIISSLGTATQNEGILDLIEEKWDDLVSHMPLKISYPALEYEEWRIITGSDPKNTPWSYHNGGSWPTLLWQFTLACIKMGKPELASKALALAEKRLPVDKWPEYYDTKHGRFIGKQSRLYQTWTIAGYLTSKMLLDNPDMASMLFWNEGLHLSPTSQKLIFRKKRGRKEMGSSGFSWKLNDHPKLPKEKIIAVVVLDGWGEANPDKYNCIHVAETPVMDSLKNGAPEKWRLVKAHGKAVGLPTDDDMGNSEVGHNALGAGRIYAQGAQLVDLALESGKIYDGEGFKYIKESFETGTLHLIGLLSDGGVHSRLDQLQLLLKGASERGAKRIRVHALTDGRDVLDGSSVGFMETLENDLAKLREKGIDAQVASGGGRMYVTMDRYENDWDVVKRGWDAQVLGEAPHKFRNAVEAVKKLREEPNANDQYLPPFVIVDENGKAVGPVVDGDAVVTINFRADRMVMLAKALEYADFDKFDRVRFPKIRYAGMLQYDGELKLPSHYLVSPPEIERTSGEYLVHNGVHTFACSETVKFGHVTFFWNGNRSGYFDQGMEEYVEIPSDSGITFNVKPKMKALEIAEKARDAIIGRKFHQVRVNLPNSDMVGHTGDIEATIVACKAADDAVNMILDAIEQVGGIYVVTADHGNAEDMVKRNKKGEPLLDKNGKIQILTSHTLQPVPIAIGGPGLSPGVKFRQDLPGAGLANVAATVMNLHGYEAPSDYEPTLIEVVDN